MLSNEKIRKIKHSTLHLIETISQAIFIHLLKPRKCGLSKENLFGKPLGDLIYEAYRL